MKSPFSTIMIAAVGTLLIILGPGTGRAPAPDRAIAQDFESVRIVRPAGPAPSVRIVSASRPDFAKSGQTGNNFGIADLFILDRLFRDQPGFLLSSGGTTIGDLLLLNQIFNSGRLGGRDNEHSLAQLFILDKLFNQPGSGLLNPEHTTLGDLLLLDRIFNK